MLFHNLLSSGFGKKERTSRSVDWVGMAISYPCSSISEKLPVEAKPPWFKQAQELDELTAVTEEPT